MSNSTSHCILQIIKKLSFRCFDYTREMEYYNFVIEKLQSKNHKTRSIQKQINEYKTICNKRSYDCLRCITEFMFIINEYNDIYYGNKTLISYFEHKIAEFNKGLTTNKSLTYPHTDDEKCVVRAFKSELLRCNMLQNDIPLVSITNICKVFDPNLLVENVGMDYDVQNIRQICQALHPDIVPSPAEINILHVISNYLLNHQELNLYKKFILRCSKKFLFHLMKNTDYSTSSKFTATKHILASLYVNDDIDSINYLYAYVREPIVESWYKQYCPQCIYYEEEDGYYMASSVYDANKYIEALEMDKKNACDENEITLINNRIEHFKKHIKKHAK
uniref:Uncharacterized protein n=1 Tax=viral metagenome TaxID=1070528 RepID=A0A6C0IR32_9ZZZZ